MVTYFKVQDPNCLASTTLLYTNYSIYCARTVICTHADRDKQNEQTSEAVVEP